MKVRVEAASRRSLAPRTSNLKCERPGNVRIAKSHSHWLSLKNECDRDLVMKHIVALMTALALSVTHASAATVTTLAGTGRDVRPPG